MKNNKEIEEFQQYVIAEAQSQNKNPEQYIKELGQEGLKEAYKRFQAHKKKQAQKAAHGAKLQYLKALKNKCAEDEQLVYYKKGGVVDCGCVKKEEGGKAAPEKENVVNRFKAKKAQAGTTISRIADATGSQGGFKKAGDQKKKTTTKPVEKKPTPKKSTFKNDYSSKRVKDSEEDYFKGTADHKVKSNCFGSKIKVSCGAKINK